MAIDMIENNDFGNFTEGRLGWQQFADEGFKNYTGNEDFYNLFGSRKRKKKAKAEEAAKKEAVVEIVDSPAKLEKPLPKEIAGVKPAPTTESVDVASTPQTAAVSQKNKNLLIYGGIGLVGLVVIALILNRK